MDYKVLAESIDQLRETLRLMVAGIMAEGFSEDQARDITVGVMTAHNAKREED